MEPGKEVSKSLEKISRRDFLRYPSFINAGWIFKKARRISLNLKKNPKFLAPALLFDIVQGGEQCPPAKDISIPQIPSESPIENYRGNPKIGVNIPRNASVPPIEIAATGASWVRFVAMGSNFEDPGKMREYLRALQETKIKSLLVIAKESIGDLGFGGAASFYATEYGGLVDAWQVGNEPDDNNGIASWKMEPEEFSNLLWVFRDAMPDKFLVAGGLDTNRPEYLSGVNTEWVNAIAVHPYGQGVPGWPSPYGFPDHVGRMVERNKFFSNGKPLWVTEWGINHNHFGESFAAEYVARMMGYLRDSKDVEVAFYYNLINKGNPEFSLMNIDESKRLSYYAFQNIAQSKEMVAQKDLRVRWSMYPDGLFLHPFPR